MKNVTSLAAIRLYAELKRLHSSPLIRSECVFCRLFFVRFLLLLSMRCLKHWFYETISVSFIRTTDINIMIHSRLESDSARDIMKTSMAFMAVHALVCSSAPSLSLYLTRQHTVRCNFPGFDSMRDLHRWGCVLQLLRNIREKYFLWVSIAFECVWEAKRMSMMTTTTTEQQNFFLSYTAGSWGVGGWVRINIGREKKQQRERRVRENENHGKLLIWRNEKNVKILLEDILKLFERVQALNLLWWKQKVLISSVIRLSFLEWEFIFLFSINSRRLQNQQQQSGIWQKNLSIWWKIECKKIFSSLPFSHLAHSSPIHFTSSTFWIYMSNEANVAAAFWLAEKMFSHWKWRKSWILMRQMIQIWATVL